MTQWLPWLDRQGRLSGLRLGVFLLVLLDAMVSRRRAEANPWGEGATTLEWTLSSPPPFHQFETLPKIVDEPAH